MAWLLPDMSTALRPSAALLVLGTAAMSGRLYRRALVPFTGCPAATARPRTGLATLLSPC